MQPTLTDVHISVPMTNMSIAYIQDQKDFVSMRFFPTIPVEKQSNKYYTYDKGDWFRDEAEKRMGAGESAGSGYHLSNDNYSADIWAFHKDIDYPTRANADPTVDVDRDAVRFVTQRQMMRQEKQFVSRAFGPSIWTNDKTGGAFGGSPDFIQWSDYVHSDPIEDVETAKEAILIATGFRATKMLIGYQVFRKLKRHPIIIDQIKYTTKVDGRTITPDLLAALFDIDEVVVASAVQNTGKENETNIMSFVHGKSALLAHVAPAPGLLVPSAGYTFSWQGVSEGMGANIGVKTIPMPWLNADRVESESAFDIKVVAPDLGYMFNSAVG